MKKILIYKYDNDFILERVNDFGHSWKRYFDSEKGLLEGLDAYRDIISEYNLDVSEDLWATVINYLYGGVTNESRG